MPINVKDIQDKISSENARWRASETPLTKLSTAERKQMLGAIPTPEATALATAAPQVTAPAFAPAIDWRNKNGNHVSPVTDQKSCGSCVSFSCCATVESMAHIESGRWLNLSEADSHFCSSHGANCGGWWPDQCLGQIKSRGVCDEAAFPYASAFGGTPSPKASQCRTTTQFQPR